VAAWSISRGAAWTIGCLARAISVMSKSVSVIITGDLDGSENAEMVSFGLDGVTCEIDLGKKNRSGLKRALAPFIEAGRRAPRSRCRPGLKVSERGRISAGIIRLYDAACQAELT
jgi:nucleoid-associated protein Lsr2